MPITATNPLIIPQKTFDRYWVGSIVIGSDVNSGMTSANIVFIPYRDVEIKDEEGNVVDTRKEVGAGYEKQFNIPDIFGLAATKPEVGLLINTMLSTIESLAKSNGII